MNHLEAAMQLDSPDFLRNLLEKHFSSDVQSKVPDTCEDEEDFTNPAKHALRHGF
jgi:hypothetical protein